LKRGEIKGLLPQFLSPKKSACASPLDLRTVSLAVKKIEERLPTDIGLRNELERLCSCTKEEKTAIFNKQSQVLFVTLFTSFAKPKVR
jgi:hypothetical protein